MNELEIFVLCRLAIVLLFGVGFGWLVSISAESQTLDVESMLRLDEEAEDGESC
jgi:hypothetical protein